MMRWVIDACGMMSGDEVDEVWNEGWFRGCLFVS